MEGLPIVWADKIRSLFQKYIFNITFEYKNQ